jgi:hypothetical protein
MKEIAAAFVQAQKGFLPALKSSENPFFHSRYADLAECIQAVIGSLNENGIALVQHTSQSETGVIVHTKFVHVSGEEMETGSIYFPAVQHTPQAFGSALTYARRYSLMTACGIAPEDDDGAAGSAPKVQPKPTATTAVGAVAWDTPADPWATNADDFPSFKTQEELEAAEAKQTTNPIAPHCDHGLRKWVQGEKNGKAWGGFMCQESEKSNQCAPQWYKLGSSGKWGAQL